MTHRQKYFLLCDDGQERTVKEIAPLLGLDNPALVTQFLMRLKSNLAQERATHKLYKIMPVKRNGAVKWRLERRMNITIE